MGVAISRGGGGGGSGGGGGTADADVRDLLRGEGCKVFVGG